jgi:hypothetical protein
MNTLMRHVKVRIPLLAMLLIAAGCSSPAAQPLAKAGVASAPPQLGRVFLAQQHVLEPTSPYFKLVGDLETLIKAQVYAETPVSSPEVFAVLELDGQRKEIRLRGPKVLPQPYEGDPVLMPHRYEDSFTAMIPRQWIRPGLEVAVELRRYDYREAHDYDLHTSSSKAVNSIHVIGRRDLGAIKVGAPSKLVMNMFDFHYFGRGVGADYPTGWEAEFQARLPIADMTVHRVRQVMLDKIVWMPHAGNPSMLTTGPEHYEQTTGKPLDGEQAMALQWGWALKRAAGRMGPWRLYYVNIAGMRAGGQARGFQSCGSLHRHGVIIHEVGHSLGLPHWTARIKYPYKSTMYGQTPGEPAKANAGPTWGFDLNRRAFLPAYVKTEQGYQWTRDPMMGGGRYAGPEYIYKHFSDYSVHRMQSYLENRVVYWNEELGQYTKWNPETVRYDQVVANDGIQLPLERDVDVISLLVTASLVVPDGSIIYRPIGPYKAGLIDRFDADSAEDRARAATLGFGEKGYNVCLRVAQGGKTTTYILDLKLSPDDDPLKAFHVAAINLPARDGMVTRAELLYTPDVVASGITDQAKVLYTWAK